jgi:hypothetical protein
MFVFPYFHDNPQVFTDLFLYNGIAMDRNTTDRFSGSTLFAIILLIAAAATFVFAIENVSNGSILSWISPSTQLALVTGNTSSSFGDASIGDYGTPGGNFAWCSPYSPSSSGTISAISGAMYGASGKTESFAIYDSNGSVGDTGTLLVSDNIGVPLPTSFGQWATSTKISLAVTAGHSYFLCEWSNDANESYAYDPAASANTNYDPGYMSFPNWSSALPNPNHSYRAISIYASYSSAGSGSSSTGGSSSPSPSSYSLSVNNGGNGTITSSPSGINCGSTCSYSFNSGTAVALTASPSSGYVFSGWSGACSGAGTCSVTMNASSSVSASFASQSVTSTPVTPLPAVTPSTPVLTSASQAQTKLTGSLTSKFTTGSTLGQTCEAINGAHCWYVDNSLPVSGTHDGMTWATAWTDVQNIEGSGSVGPGDYIYISGGATTQTYYIKSWWRLQGGSSSAWVTYKPGQDAGHNGIAIFDGSTLGSGAQGNLIEFVNNYTIFNGDYNGQRHFQVRNFGGGAQGFINGSGKIGQKLEYTDIDTGNADFHETTTQIEIDHNYIKAGEGTGDTLNIGGLYGSTWSVNSVHDNTILVPSTQSSTLCTGCGADGIKWGASVDIYNNSITSYYDPFPYINEHQDGIQIQGQYTKIYDNYISNTVNSGIFVDNGGDGYDLSHIYIYNNVFEMTVPDLLNTTSRGIEFTCGDNDTDHTCSGINDVRVYNNTIVNYPSDGMDMVIRHPDGWPNPVNWTPPPIHNIEVKNNIFVNDGHHSGALTVYNDLINEVSGFTTTATPSDIVVDNNLVDPGPWGASGVYPLQAHGFSWQSGSEGFFRYTPLTGSSPQMSSPNDLHLWTSDTGARNNGVNLFQYFQTDKDLVPRPQSGAWDIGAYQFVPNTNCTSPGAYFSMSGLSAQNNYEPLAVGFDGSGSDPCAAGGGGALSYHWNFGDGATSNAASPSHTFSAGVWNIALTVTNNLGSNSVSRQITVLPALVPDLILGINFDNTIQDWSGKGNTEQWVGTPCYGAGMIGSSGCFNGISGSTVTVSQNPSLEGMNQLTLAAWAKKSSATSGGGIIGKYTVYELSIEGVNRSGGCSNIYTASSGGVCLEVPAGLTADTQWHHYAMTYDGSKATLYVDGNQVAEQALSGAVAVAQYQNLIIGTQQFDGSGYQFNGSIDDVRVYDKALSASDVLALYNDRTTTVPPVRNNGLPSGVVVAGTTNTTLSLSTNVTAACRYSTTPNTLYASMPSGNTFSTSDGFVQTTPISGLSPGNYSYYARCQDYLRQHRH